MPRPKLNPASGRPWFRVKAVAEGEADVYIYDEIGDSWWGDSTSAKDFVDQLKALGPVAQINLHINSPGGSVFDGVAIYNTLRANPASVTTYVDGYAASIASIVALAGDRIVMPANTMLMIHNPWSLAIGDANEMRSVADSLDKIREAMVSTYLGRTTKDETELLAAMDAETWLTAADAAEWGFADEVTEPLQAAALSRFDFAALGFRHAPAASAAIPPDAAEPVAVGRTLSTENEGKLTDARDLIDQVLSSVDGGSDDGGGDGGDGATSDSLRDPTADSARTVDRAEVAAMLRSAFD